MSGHPLDPFLAAWSAASGIDGFASRLRVYRALELPGPWTRARLNAVLASLLVPKPDLNARFQDTFESWFADDGRDRELSALDPKEFLRELRRRIPRSEQPRPVSQDRAPGTSTKVAAPSRRWSLGRLRYLPATVGVVFVLATLIAGGIRLRKRGPAAPQAGPVPAPLPVTEANHRSPAPAPVVGGYPELRVDIGDLPPSGLRRQRLFIACAFLAAILTIEIPFWLKRRRFRTPRIPRIKLNDQLELQFDTGERPQPLSPRELDRLAFRTGLRPDFEAPRLNVAKSVKKTASQAGLFTPIYDPQRRTRGVTLVTHSRMDAVAEAIVDELARGLQMRGVPVQVTTGAPRWDSEDLVLVLVDARWPSDPPIDRWLALPSVSLVETRDPWSWGVEVSRLPRRAFPLDADGLYQALESAAAGHHPSPASGTRRHDSLAELDPSALGEARPLAVACSLISPCNLGTADRMRRDLMPHMPFLAFQRVLRLRGVTADPTGWRFSAGLAKQLQSSVGPEFARRVLAWQRTRLAALEAPVSSRAAEVLLRERALVDLELALLALTLESPDDAPTERDLLAVIRRLELQRGEAGLDRRMRERLMSMPSAWLGQPDLPSVAAWRLFRLCGVSMHRPAGADPGRKPSELWFLNAGLLATCLVIVAKPPGNAPAVLGQLNPGTAILLVQWGNEVIRPDESPSPDVQKWFVWGSAPRSKVVAFGKGAPAVVQDLQARTGMPTKVTVSLKTEKRWPPGWKCLTDSYHWLSPDTKHGNRELIASIVSLPQSPSYDGLAGRLLDNEIASCVVREADMSLPEISGDTAQVLRYKEDPDAFPKQTDVGQYIQNHFWLRPAPTSTPRVHEEAAPTTQPARVANRKTKAKLPQHSKQHVAEAHPVDVPTSTTAAGSASEAASSDPQAEDTTEETNVTKTGMPHYDQVRMGWMYERRGDLQRALEHYQRALSIDSTSGFSHESRAGDLRRVGDVLAKLGQTNHAEEYFDRALKTDSDAFGSMSASVAVDLRRLAELKKKARPSDALPLYMQVLSIDTALLGASDPNTRWDAYKALIDDSMSAGRTPPEKGSIGGTRAYFDIALQMTERRYGVDSVKVAAVLAEMANRPKSDPHSARLYLQRALAILEKLGDKEGARAVHAMIDEIDARAAPSGSPPEKDPGK
jgi:tetratricopeptide (TPR) repeat protein